MRWMALALLVILVIGPSRGYPLHASNGVVNCTIYGAFKDPWATANANANSYAVLNVDLSLEWINSSNKSSIGAAYSLTDGNDRAYKSSPDYTRELQTSRRLIGFVVPKETIAKSLTVDLSTDPAAGDQFSIPFAEVANSSNGKVTLLYYGITRTWSDSNKKTIELDMSLNNNDTHKLFLNAENFSLVDQWGWKYGSQEYDHYGRKGLSAVNLEPNGTIRSGLIFSSLSPLSRPAELIYRYSNNSSLALDIDPEAGLKKIEKAPEKCSTCGNAEEISDASSLAGSIKATKARLAKVKKNNTEEVSAPKGRDEL
ncbi:Uncharacterised protein [uncultured archaeon]|nr:Uncharacterised protein [uncultured archaeon]